MSLHVHFRLSTRKEQLPVEDWLKNVPALVDYYLERPNLTCCDFQGGYCIDSNGKRWNGNAHGYTFDEPWMTLHWLYGLITVSGGEKEAHVGFWEQSSAKVKWIDEKILEISDDAAHAGAGECAPTWVDTDEFISQIIRETHAYVHLCDAIETELTKRGTLVPEEKLKKIITELNAGMFREKLLELEEILKKDKSD